MGACEQTAEMGISRDDNSALINGTIENCFIAGSLHRIGSHVNRIVASLTKKSSQGWRQRVINKKFQAEAGRGSSPSRRVAAA